MDLRTLESFVAVAEELHFGRAAERAHLSQPALSQQIQRLERELGFAVFSRDRRRVALTPAGAVLLDRARRLLDDAAEMVAAAGDVAAGRAGTLFIGYVGGALYGAMPPIVRRLRREAPGVALTVTEHKTTEQLERLRDGSLDAAFIHLPAEPLADLCVTEFDRERLVLALPAGHRLAERRRIRLTDLAGDPFVMFPRRLEPDTHDRIARACAAAGFEPHVVQEATNLQSLIGFVAAGMGAGFVVESVGRNLRRDGVVFRPVAPPSVELTNALVWRSDSANTALRHLARAVEQAEDDVA